MVRLRIKSAANMNAPFNTLKNKGLVPSKSRLISLATLLLKPDKLKVELDIHYVAMRIPNDFIVGYGLDYDGLGRNYRDIYTVME